MKTDSYTRLLLTVIAVCLMVLTAHTLELFPAVSAAADKPTGLVDFAKVPLNEDGSITLRLAPTEVINVNITDVSTHDNLNVNINEVGGYSVWGKIPVEIKE